MTINRVRGYAFITPTVCPIRLSSIYHRMVN